MAMQQYDSIAAARSDIVMYIMKGVPGLNDAAKATLAQIQGMQSSVDQICRTAELLYVYRDEIDADGRDLVASLAMYAAINGWHFLGHDGRGQAIAAAMQRDNKVKAPDGVTWPKAADDPEPSPEYAPQTASIVS